MATLYFNSEDLPPKDRLDIAHEYYSRLANVNIVPCGDESFFADARFCFLHNVSVAQIERSHCRVYRTKAQAASGSDDLTLFINTDGDYQIHQQGGRPARFSAGHAYLSPADCPGHSDLSRRGVDVVFPRAELEPLLAHPNRVLRRQIEASPALVLLTDYAAALTRQLDPVPPAVARLAAEHLRDLAVAALGGTRDALERAREGGIRAARVQAIKKDVMNNLAQPGLSATAMAVRHGISPRYLRSLFAQEGLSFTDFVLQQRLARSYELVTDPALAHWTISRLALDCGFEDMSWFNRSFKRRFGMSPRDARQQAFSQITRP